MTDKRNLLIIGAKPNSIGEAVLEAADNDWNIYTAGVSDEGSYLDVGAWAGTSAKRAIAEVIGMAPMHAVVCTAGINHEATLAVDDWALGDLEESFQVNVLGPLAVLEQWLRYWEQDGGLHRGEDDENLHFVMMSSNSAGVVRSTGLPYNASKAALSMAVRCVARSVARRDTRISVYGYEPGWVEGTPMSQEVMDRLPNDVEITRVPGLRTMRREDLGNMIVRNFGVVGMMNGCLLRVDGGEA